MLSRSLVTIAVIVAALIVIIGGPKLGRAGIQPATPILINGDLGERVAALETRVAALEAHLGTPQGAQGAGTPSPMSPSTPAATGSQIAEVRLEGYDIGWTQREVSVTPGTIVTLINTGAAGHNFEVTELGINIDMPVGETVTATIPADAAPGEYEFRCNIPGHAPAGMVGKLIVQAAGSAVAQSPGHEVTTPPLDQASPPGGSGLVAEVTIEGYDIGWSAKEVTVSPGTMLMLENTGAAGHNFEVTELGINVDMPVDGTVEVIIPIDAQPGTYTFFCNIPGHKEAGMVGTLLVQGSAVTRASETGTPPPSTPPFTEGNAGVSTLPQTANTAEWAVTVTRTEMSEAFETGNKRHVPRGVYVFVYMTVTRTANVPDDFPYSDLALTDSAGRTFFLDSEATIYRLDQVFDLSWYEQLQPDLPYDGIAIFDIPRDATGLALTTQGQQFTIPLDR